jgi:hypothetical protein
MTVHEYESAPSPRNAPESLKILPPMRGRRERRVLAAPAVSGVITIAHGNPALQSVFTHDATASTASRPNVRDDGQRPSLKDRAARAGSADLPDRLSGILPVGLICRSHDKAITVTARPNALSHRDGHRSQRGRQRPGPVSQQHDSGGTNDTAQEKAEQKMKRLS